MSIDCSHPVAVIAEGGFSSTTHWRKRGLSQVLLISGCHFCTVGIWNSLNGMGGLGIGDLHLSHLVNIIMYINGIVVGILYSIVRIKFQTLVFLGVVAFNLQLLLLHVYGNSKADGNGDRVRILVLIYTWIMSISLTFMTTTISLLIMNYAVPDQPSFETAHTQEIELAVQVSSPEVFSELPSRLVSGSPQLHSRHPASLRRKISRKLPSGNMAKKGQLNLFLSLNSIILNVGGFMGSIVSFFLSWDNVSGSASPRALPKRCYFALMGLSSIGIIFASLLKSPSKVVRSDGSTPAMPERNSSIRRELENIGKGLMDVNLLLLVPLFSVSVWHEVVLFNYFNASLFNIRSRAFNSSWYYVARIVSSHLFKCVVDARDELKSRVIAALSLVGGFVCAGTVTSLVVFSGALGIKYETELDFLDARSLVVAGTFFIYGSLETMASSLMYWLIGVLPLGDVNRKGRLVGLSKTFINIGGALSWYMDVGDSQLEYFSQWGLNLLVWIVSLFGAWCTYRRNERHCTR